VTAGEVSLPPPHDGAARDGTQEMSRRLIYDRKVDPSALPREYLILLDLIGEGSSVVEVGPHTGYFTRLLRDRDCHVMAIERDGEAAAYARAFANELLVGDIEDPGLELPSGAADVVLFSHVLEHLVDPVATLLRAHSWLRKDGRVIAAIPNIAFWRVRVDLLRGRFDYTPTGILDETHLRFYTIRAAHKLFERTGYDVRLCVPGCTHAPAIGWIKRLPRVGEPLAATWQAAATQWCPGLATVSFVLEAMPRADAP
jgi:SAM-dependent methyltransferase